MSAWGSKAAAGLGGFCDRVRDLLRVAEAVGFDETSLRVDGANWWVHTATTPELTLLSVHERRGGQATHALCGAHILRELVAVTETSATGGQWAIGIIVILCELKHAADTAREAGEAGLEPVWLAERVRLFAAAARVGFNVSSGRRNDVEAKHNALARRLLDRREDILRFAHDLRVPFDNNGSEQSIRMVKLRQKISGTMRAAQGAQDFVTIRSYLQTAGKQGQNALDVLTALFEGPPWLPSTS